VLRDELSATVCWLVENPLRPGARVLVKHGTRTVQAMVTELVCRLDEQTLARVPSPDAIAMNEIGQVLVRLAEPLPVDDYAVSRRTGSFVLIDPSDGSTLAAGLVGAPLRVLA
jgi:sulfate adenylyltransferase subunit 1